MARLLSELQVEYYTQLGVSILETVVRICRPRISTKNLDFGILCGMTIAICTLHCRQKFDDRGYMSKSSRKQYQSAGLVLLLTSTADSKPRALITERNFASLPGREAFGYGVKKLFQSPRCRFNSGIKLHQPPTKTRMTSDIRPIIFRW